MIDWAHFPPWSALSGGVLIGAAAALLLLLNGRIAGISGILGGAGTRYGSVCTSGQGVCGLSWLSPRSLAATAAFMGAGFVTVFSVRHLLA